MGATVPSLQDPLLKRFIRLIVDDRDIRMPGAMRGAERQDNLMAQLVNCSPLSSGRVDQCWFNCRAAAASIPGAAVVFGWHIFEFAAASDEVRFVAGHHAVIDHLGALIDVTPQVDTDGEPLSAPTLFVPDSRVPFDYEQLRTVPAFHWWPKSERKVWSLDIMDPYARPVPRFGTVRLI